MYLTNFYFVNSENDFDFAPDEAYYSSVYPYHILCKHKIEKINFEQITIFYGGNGCGKTTALNIIAEKLRLQRDSLYNKTNFFDKYLSNCHYEAYEIPRKSRIITSDDVFEYSMNLRYINDGLDNQREKLVREYVENKYNKFSISDFNDFEKIKEIKKSTKFSYIRNNIKNKNIREQSNGESGFWYFTNKIEENALYLLDEPENSLSPEKQLELLQFIEESARFFHCQFVIATHSPFLLSLKGAKIYDFDENPTIEKKWTDLKNVRDYYKFFKEHEKEFL